ncbi:MAG: NADH-quinone oxidoreductase subunit I [Bacteroidota bacterium]|nr:NADH-quinone oxidoreductase subunit I [Bacteroidota bacterium]MDP4196629.1 NADH-quinone oxidoreductase subunit I [Bacteroidota bacterium]
MKQYLKNTWEGIWTVLVGMKITFKHLFVPAVTIQYPEVKIDLPDRSRNRLYVNIDDCIGCDQCSRACPVDCITIETVKGTPDEDLGKTSNGKKKALWVTQFDIDFAKCCCCGLCTFPCPTECIKMTDVYEFSEYERENLLYKFATLSEDEIAIKKQNYAKVEAEKAAQKAAAAAAAAKAKAEAQKQAEAAPKTETAPKAEAAPSAAKPDTKTSETRTEAGN